MTLYSPSKPTNHESSHDEDEPRDVLQGSTEQLLAMVVAQLGETNTFLHNLQLQGVASASVRDSEELERKKKNAKEKAQDYATWTWQFVSSGSIIAIFLSALNVALVSYANDVTSQLEMPTLTDKIMASCWFVSLAISLMVVTTDSVWSLLYLWVHASRSGNIKNDFWRGPWTELDYSKRPHNFADAKMTTTDMMNKAQEKYGYIPLYQISDMVSYIVFLSNLLVLPALCATIIGCIAFSWTKLSRLTAISTSVAVLVTFFAFTWGCVEVALLVTRRSRAMKKTYRVWAEESTLIRN